jgi:hypothetical protein
MQQILKMKVDDSAAAISAYWLSEKERGYHMN